jgi:hypothetical protein
MLNDELSIIVINNTLTARLASNRLSLGGIITNIVGKGPGLNAKHLGHC